MIVQSGDVSSTTTEFPPRLREGIALFNAGEFFEAHEALEDAWR